MRPTAPPVPPPLDLQKSDSKIGPGKIGGLV